MYQSNGRELTLKVVSFNDIILFFKHTIKGFCKIDVCEGVTIVESFSFNSKYRVENYWHKPAELPNYLESYITKCVSDAFNNLRVDNNDNFFDRNFARGGMMPLKNVKKHPEWQTKYIGQVDTKDVNMCISCGFRAYKGCCSEYSAKNRKKIRMAIGWHELP